MKNSLLHSLVATPTCVSHDILHLHKFLIAFSLLFWIISVCNACRNFKSIVWRLRNKLLTIILQNSGIYRFRVAPSFLISYICTTISCSVLELQICWCISTYSSTIVSSFYYIHISVMNWNHFASLVNLADVYPTFLFWPRKRSNGHTQSKLKIESSNK